MAGLVKIAAPTIFYCCEREGMLRKRSGKTKVGKVPQCVSSIISKFRTRGEWQVSGLLLQHPAIALRVRLGPNAKQSTKAIFSIPAD